MQIELNGILYETTEETKDQYVIRYFASKIVKYIQYIIKEYQDYLYFNSDWDRIIGYDNAKDKLNKDSLPYDSRSVRADNKNEDEIDKANRDSLARLDKYRPVRRSNKDINTSTSIGNSNPEPDMKLGHFSAKRFDNLLKKMNSEGETQLPLRLGKDSDDDPVIRIPISRIINEKNFSGLVGMVSSKGQDQTNLDNMNDAYRQANKYETTGYYTDRSQAKYFYDKLNSAKGVTNNNNKYPSDEDMYEFFKNYGDFDKLTVFIDMFKKVTLALTVGDTCGMGRLCVKNDNASAMYILNNKTIVIPIFEKSRIDFATYDEKLIQLRIATFNRNKIYSTLIHELTHAYDDLIDSGNFYKSEDDDKSYRKKSYEVNAFSAQLAEKIEVIIRREIQDMIQKRSDLRDNSTSDTFNSYVSTSNFIYNMFSSFDNFLETLISNVDVDGSPFINFLENESSTLVHMENDPEYKEIISKKVKPWYEDLKDRYRNVIPSKELPLKSPMNESEFKGTCDRFRKTRVGEAEWQEMMSTATRIGQRYFMKSVEIKDVLDEDEDWKDFLRTHEDVKFYESPKYYFMQTRGFEYIWEKEPEIEDIIEV